MSAPEEIANQAARRRVVELFPQRASANKAVAAPCFLLHRWTLWYEVPDAERYGTFASAQKRACTRCGKAQVKRLCV